ncbi:MAG TPA: TOBE domain-containing protein [Gaiellaceae bacterium]|nr:TOBE domain-containing protein [Gaiellaceae bacterium]
MQLSARNQLDATVTKITLGTIMAEVAVDIGGQEVVSAITRGSAEKLGLKEGDEEGNRGDPRAKINRWATQPSRVPGSKRCVPPKPVNISGNQ